MITKIIKVGNSYAVTLPKKQIESQGLTYGDELKVTYEPANAPDQDKVELVELTQKLIKRHKTALKNLSQR